ncbi:rust resistance kinase Lr10-like [Coffea arabica]|uniref:Rust resistance kinase Lr10-like n=1 Tax=Coffea arabica TaxID=13443 RepID=A0A6P6SXG1_COFAR
MFLSKAFAVCLALLFVEAVSTRIDQLEEDKPQKDKKCYQQFYCGEVHIYVTGLFRVEGGPQGCGHPNVRLSCEHNRTVLYLGSNSNKYYVEEKSIMNFGSSSKRIHVIDPGVQKNNCSSLPLYSITHYSYNPLHPPEPHDSIILVSCKRPIDSPLYIDTSPCLTAKDFYSYVVFGNDLMASNIEETCTIYKTITSQFQNSLDVETRNISYRDVHDMMASGFELEWMGYSDSFCSSALCFGAIGTGGFFGICIALSIAYYIYELRRRYLSLHDAIEKFLKSRNNLIPRRYSYREIKKMSNNFKEKLGEGGYGSVYKGKLRSGQLVAIKMLTKSKANGQDFINEVASLGRIHHVNVVRLAGFCVTASKRALIYEYMPNGSLDKFIFAEHSNRLSLSWKKAFEIASGVARGIQYLHQGCNMQIVHFDIKPHNILLDDNFVPKVSDFGLAKLHPLQNSVVSLTVVRGTLGYMAPELFYKKIGNVSNKADVYSFGMLLMEMAGRRKNINALAEHSSQIYFPSWIYDNIDQGEDMEIGDHATEEEKTIRKKLILTALWCIQMIPENRPSMREVIEMLGGDLQDLQLPAKPRFYPSDSPVRHLQSSSYSCSEESTESPCNSVPLEIEQIDR